ncbi:hypothetical protein HPP92_020717 [Vanilla planifolia]|uniref:Uncharacterized protein n=1 Tax=Vanilla planifolia TaxID=51239 RepID=A0A835UGV4_VANPL|nr:hypothetical protein HPP92_020717 [Vanilla planifolia]
MPPRRYALRWTEDAVHPDTVRAVLSEFLATAIFVFAGEGSVLSLGKLQKDTFTVGGLVLVALAHAFAFAVAVAIAFNSSGGHVNPAITLGALVGGRISVLRAVLYWIAQVLGSVAATVLVWVATAGMRPVGFVVAAGVGRGHAVLMEIVLTFGLVYTTYATAIDPRRGSIGIIAPLAVGFIMGANVLVGGPFDGAAMNPARAFGPALVGWRWTHHWVYWLGPLLGGALAGLVYEFLVAQAEVPPTHHQPLAPEDY